MAVLLVDAAGAPLEDGGGDFLATTSPAPAYTGPLDIVSGAVVAYSQRAMSAAMLGTAVYTVRRDSDDTTQVFSSDAVTGAVDTAAIAAFIGASFTQTGAVSSGDQTIVLVDVTGVAIGQLVTGTSLAADTFVQSLDIPTLTITVDPVPIGSDAAAVLTFGQIGMADLWDDQSGNAKHATPTDPTIAPIWRADLGLGTPGLQGLAQARSVLGFPSVTLPNGVATLFLVTGNSSSFDLTIDPNFTAYLEVDVGSRGFLDMSDGTNEAGGNFNNSLPGVDALAVWDAHVGFGASDLNFNGVAVTDTSPINVGGPLASIANIGAITIQGYPPATQIQELIIYGTTLSAPDRLAIRTNIAAYYGITL